MNASTPDLLYSQVEDDLRASVRDLLTDHCSAESLLARAESAEPYDLKLWHTLAADLGAAGLGIDEERGGHGGSARETAVVAEELGRSVAPVPFLGSTILATAALLGIENPNEAAAELLRRLASGERTASLTVPLSTMPGNEITATVRPEGGGLHGQVTTVGDASAANVLLVPVRASSGLELHAVETGGAGVTVSEAVPLDLTRRVADVSLAGVSGTLLAGAEQAEPSLDYALTSAATLLASEQVGIAQWCLDETVRYTSQRYQFGRPIGSFQALKHRLADLYLELVKARATARNAADALATGSPDSPVAASIAQSYCADVTVHAAEECVQLHGGIGMTWEHPAHLYLKRAKANQLALGTSATHRTRLAGLVDLPA